MTELDKIIEEIAEKATNGVPGMFKDSIRKEILTSCKGRGVYLDLAIKQYATTMCNQQKAIIAERLQDQIAKEIILNTPLPEELL